MRTICLVLLLDPLLAACNPLGVFSVYKMEIQQGNYVTQEMVWPAAPTLPELWHE